MTNLFFKQDPRQPEWKNAVSSKPLTISILPINDPPKILPTNPIAPFISAVGDYWVQVVDVMIVDPDAKEGYMMVQLQTDVGNSLVFDPDGTVNYEFNGTNQLTIRVCKKKQNVTSPCARELYQR